MFKHKNGFTIIELLIVLVIISILAILAVPRLADIIRKSKETATKGSLATLRSAVEAYHTKNNELPAYIDTPPFIGNYIDKIPKATLGISKFVDSREVKTGGEINNAGGWYYNPDTGEVKVNCNKTDTKGQIISTW